MKGNTNQKERWNNRSKAGLSRQTRTCGHPGFGMFVHAHQSAEGCCIQHSQGDWPWRCAPERPWPHLGDSLFSLKHEVLFPARISVHFVLPAWRTHSPRSFSDCVLWAWALESAFSISPYSHPLPKSFCSVL